MSIVRRVKLVKMEMVRVNMDLGPDYFLDEYPGSFLLPIGLLAQGPDAAAAAGPSADPSATGGRTRHRLTEEVMVLESEDTLAMDFEERLRHAHGDHPLAGSAFFIRHLKAAPSLIIGRNATCDLCIPEPSVSDRHCEIMLDDQGRLTGVDLLSKNGTSVNLQRVVPGAPMMIEDEDILTIGRYSFEFFRAESLYQALQVVYQGG